MKTLYWILITFALGILLLTIGILYRFLNTISDYILGVFEGIK